MNITQKFNRHIGRVLTFLDAGCVSEELKQIVKGELWTMHNDIKEELEKDSTHNGTQSENNYNR